jgi:hypothetical protein
MITLALGALALLLTFAGTTRATSVDPATLFINGGAGDPNLIVGGSFKVIQNSGGAGTIANVILLFSVPGVLTSPSGISGLTSSVGAVGSLSLAGILATSSTCNMIGSKEVYSCANVATNTDQSNSLVNFNTAELAHNGFTATSYGIFEDTITGANLAAKGSITIGGIFPLGTFVDAYGCDATGTCYATPFTEAGLTTVPEPGSLALFGSGLIGLAGLLRRKLAQG